MSKADYSIASQEERQKVVEILQRNLDEMLKRRRTSDPEKLRQTVETFCERVQNGEVIRGKDFEKLVRLFRKQAID